METILKKRQEEILEAALEILAREGSYALTTRNLARTLGITEPALYRHFESKKDLLKALYGFVWQKMEKRLSSALQGPPEFPERLRAFLNGFFHYLAENRGINLVLLSEAIHHNDPELKAAMLALLERVYDLIEKILKEAKREGKVKGYLDLKVLSRMILGFVQATVTLSHFSDQPLECPQAVETFLTVFLEGAKP